MENKRRDKKYGKAVRDAPVDTSELADKVCSIDYQPLCPKLTHICRRRSSVMSRDDFTMKVLSERKLKRSFVVCTKFYDQR